MNSPHVVLLDNHDSFVYNLVDALAGYRTTVYRNSVSVAEVLAAEPDIIVLSPGPGHPRDAGCMMELIDATLGTIPILGVCLGFQALLDYHGGGVGPCGPVHGKSMPMTLTDADPAQPGVPGTQVPVARYHSLGCTHVPAGMRVLAETEAEIGTIAMAAETDDGMALGMQFHPESILSPRGPDMLDRCIHRLSTHPTTELKD